MGGYGVFPCDLWPVAQGFETLQPTATETVALTPCLQFLHGIGAALLFAHVVSKHLPGLKIAGWLAVPRQHHAAANIGHHRRELNEGVIAHFLEITIPHKGGFDPGYGIAQFRERDWLTVIKLLPIGSRHRDGCRLIKALIQQKREQCGQNPGVVLVEGIAEPGEHRSHVLGGFDVLPFNVVNPCGHLDVG